MVQKCQSDPGQEFTLPEGECRELVQRIAASSEFHRATRQREFLLYVVDRKLAGRSEEITEALIGHRVYGRPASYDAGNDSIVRTEARTLRKRLERYFEGEGVHEHVVIDIPRGGYVPVFRPRVEAIQSPVLPPPPPPTQPSLPSRRQWLWLGASALTGAVAVVGWRSPQLIRARDEAIPAYTPGLVQLESSDAELNGVFQRAKQRAMSCVYTGDPVGEWYATRPDGGSNVFGMRNVAHQSLGAAVLGLHRHTYNMLRCFAKSVSRSRDWCGYWVITKDGFAAPSSYTSDNDFGYCLPANFDILRSCHRQFRWTGDGSYLTQDFLNFYDITVNNYTQLWDQDHDGIMENLRRPRVHASYFAQKPNFLTGADLIAAQYAGYITYAAMQELIGHEGSLSKRLVGQYRDKADALRKLFNREWWNPAWNRFYSGTLPDRSLAADFVSECNLYTLLFGLPEDGPKTEAALDTAENQRPQFPGAYSYLPEVLYRYDRNDSAYTILLELGGDTFFGKDEGEPAFAVIGSVGSGLMGLAPNAPTATVESFPRLGEALKWAKLSRVPVLRNEIAIEHRGIRESTLTNSAGPALQWKVSFPASDSKPTSQIVVDGVPMPTTLERRPYLRPVISAVVRVSPGQTRSAKYVA